MRSSKPPPAPDPVKVAEAQTKSNRETAVAQAGLNSQNQITPYGSSTWRQVGTWADGTPRFEETVEFSPEQKALYDQQVGMSSKFNTIAGDQLNRVQETLSKPWDLNAAAQDQFSDIARKRLDPEWEQRNQAQEANLAARGVMPGSEAYDRAMRQFGEQRNDAYNNMYLSGRGQAVQEALMQRNQPMSEINLLRSGGQPTNPTFEATTQTGVANTDIAGIYDNTYKGQLAAWKQQQENNNALLGNVFKLGGTALSGWMGSDPRLKNDMGVVGEAAGLPIHAYTLKKDGPKGLVKLGFMADEVAEVKPWAVKRTGPRGMMAVNYPAALAS